MTLRNSAWAVGRSWGGQLALHLLVTHPERLLGVVCVDPLGAHEIFAEFGENLRRGLTAEQVARIDEVEARRRAGETTEADLIERMAIPDCGHFPWLERPGELRRAVERQLARLRGATSRAVPCGSRIPCGAHLTPAPATLPAK